MRLAVKAPDLPAVLPPFGVTLRNGTEMRVKREGGEWHVAGKRRRQDAVSKRWTEKWVTETDTALEWAIGRLNSRAPNDADALLAIYILETKVPALL